MALTKTQVVQAVLDSPKAVRKLSGDFWVYRRVNALRAQQGYSPRTEYTDLEAFLRRSTLNQIRSSYAKTLIDPGTGGIRSVAR